MCGRYLALATENSAKGVGSMRIIDLTHPLNLIPRSNRIRTLITTGIATDVCVETTARDRFCRDYYMVLLRDYAAAFFKELHNNTLKNVALHFGEVVDSSDVLRCWQASRT